jgi:class 3 adenylate cyclase
MRRGGFDVFVGDGDVRFHGLGGFDGDRCAWVRRREELRQTHFRLLRAAVAASGGTEVKNLGDGLMVTYSSPSRALAGAVGMQQAIEHHNRTGEQSWRCASV